MLQLPVEVNNNDTQLSALSGVPVRIRLKIKKIPKAEVVLNKKVERKTRITNPDSEKTAMYVK